MSQQEKIEMELNSFYNSWINFDSGVFIHTPTTKDKGQVTRLRAAYFHINLCNY